MERGLLGGLLFGVLLCGCHVAVEVETPKTVVIQPAYHGIGEVVNLLSGTDLAFDDKVIMDRGNNTITATLPKEKIEKLQVWLKQVDIPVPQMEMGIYFIKTTRGYVEYFKEELPKHRYQGVTELLTRIERQHKLEIIIRQKIRLTGNDTAKMMRDERIWTCCECSSVQYEAKKEYVRKLTSFSALEAVISTKNDNEFEFQLEGYVGKPFEMNSIEYKTTVYNYQTLVLDDLFYSLNVYYPFDKSNDREFLWIFTFTKVEPDPFKENERIRFKHFGGSLP